MLFYSGVKTAVSLSDRQRERARGGRGGEFGRCKEDVQWRARGGGGVVVLQGGRESGEW